MSAPALTQRSTPPLHSLKEVLRRDLCLGVRPGPPEGAVAPQLSDFLVQFVR